MPPRYSYWTILAGGLPTAFRAAEREDLLPTFNRIREKHPDAEMKWFARGRLWASPEEPHRPIFSVHASDAIATGGRAVTIAIRERCSRTSAQRARNRHHGVHHQEPPRHQTRVPRGHVRNPSGHRQRTARPPSKPRPAATSEQPVGPARTRPSKPTGPSGERTLRGHRRNPPGHPASALLRGHRRNPPGHPASALLRGHRRNPAGHPAARCCAATVETHRAIRQAHCVVIVETQRPSGDALRGHRRNLPGHQPSALRGRRRNPPGHPASALRGRRRNLPRQTAAPHSHPSDGHDDRSRRAVSSQAGLSEDARDALAAALARATREIPSIRRARVGARASRSAAPTNSS